MDKKPNCHAFHCMCYPGEYCAYMEPKLTFAEKWIDGMRVFDQWFFRKEKELPTTFDELFNL